MLFDANAYPSFACILRYQVTEHHYLLFSSLRLETCWLETKIATLTVMSVLSSEFG